MKLEAVIKLQQPGNSYASVEIESYEEPVVPVRASTQPLPVLAEGPDVSSTSHHTASSTEQSHSSTSQQQGSDAAEHTSGRQNTGGSTAAPEPPGEVLGYEEATGVDSAVDAVWEDLAAEVLAAQVAAVQQEQAMQQGGQQLGEPGSASLPASRGSDHHEQQEQEQDCSAPAPRPFNQMPTIRERIPEIAPVTSGVSSNDVAAPSGGAASSQRTHSASGQCQSSTASSKRSSIAVPHFKPYTGGECLPDLNSFPSIFGGHTTRVHGSRTDMRCVFPCLQLIIYNLRCRCQHWARIMHAQ